jgi:hypothetical protein
MKKIKLSLAVVTLVVAIAGTATANAIKVKKVVDPCWLVDPERTECLDAWPVVCCFDDWGNPVNEKFP